MRGGEAVAQLSRLSNSLEKRVIQQDRLYPGSAGNPGDVNKEGDINIVDALLAAQYEVNLNPVDFIPGLADTDCDGNIDIIDTLLIAQYYVELIKSFR